MVCLLLPSPCNLCGERLNHAGRLPVCANCLNSIAPLPPESSCSRCGKASEERLCAFCRVHPPAYDSAASWTLYDGAARSVLHLYKYRRVLSAGAWFAARLAPMLPAAAEVLVPVPLAIGRQRERGFNQSELLALRLARLAHLPCDTAALARRRETWPQAGLSREERERNVNGAFRVPEPRRVAGRSILLIDDVLTTGATAQACARVLKATGASAVHLLTISRADLDFAGRALAGFA